MHPSEKQGTRANHLLVPPWASQMMPHFHTALPTLISYLILKKKKKILLLLLKWLLNIGFQVTGTFVEEVKCLTSRHLYVVGSCGSIT